MQDNVDTQLKIDLFSPVGEAVPEGTPNLSEGEEVLDMGDDFDFGDFQVVRREFFAHLREPSLTFNNCRIYVNSASLTKFPNTDYMQVLINRQTKILALRPCREGERDSFPWCSYSKGKRKPKQITCKLFFAKIFTMMEWTPDFRYKLLGTVIHSKGEYLLAFDLTSTEVYQKTYAEGEKPKASRTPVFPSGWQNQFGLPFYEHRQSMQVNIFDGYAIYAIKDNTVRNTISTSDNGNADEVQSLLPPAPTFGGSYHG